MPIQFTVYGDVFMLRRTFLLTSLGALAACETPIAVPRYADITFRHRPKINLDVAKVTVVEAYQGPGALPNVEHEFPIPPQRMARNWARDRLNAVGSSGEVVFTIREAPVIEVPLEKKQGLSGLVTVDQAERYEARLVVEMRAENPALGNQASAVTSVERKRTVPEDITINEREGIWYKMTEDMAGDLDKQLQDSLHQYFGAFLR